MAARKHDWDYALRIRGTTPRAVPLARLGEYLKAYAALLGDANSPTYAGVVNGSALLRASVEPDRKAQTRTRLLAVSAGVDDALLKANDTLAQMLAADGLSGAVEDRSRAVILEFRRPDLEPESTLTLPAPPAAASVMPTTKARVHANVAPAVALVAV